MSGEVFGQISALDPAGTEAKAVAELFWIMATGALLAWALTIMAALWAAFRKRPARQTQSVERLLIIGGGVVMPTLVVGSLLVYGLRTTGSLRADAQGAPITVTSERFWWRVQYARDSQTPDSRHLELANEIRLPVGQRTELRLRSPDLIHSLWIPSLAGKVDMLPGRETRMVLQPTRIGRYRGVCAEYCGVGHAGMALTVEVMTAAAFARWLQAQRAPALTAVTKLERDGATAFVAWGCPACHTVRGTTASGVIGPDLTHVGSRPTLAAGTLHMNEASLQRWIRNPAQIKPGALMPAFAMIPDAELAALSNYLIGLQ